MSLELVSIMDAALLRKYKIPELKNIAKKYNLKISGAKPALIERIREHLGRENACIVIQRIFRGHMVRYLFYRRGPAYKNHSLCVNDCDGCTMEPLSVIPFQRFFSCTDDKGFIYGFDLLSLLTMQKKSKMTNPYTREPMSREMVKKINTLGRLLLFLFPELVDKEEREMIDVSRLESTQRTRRTTRNGGLTNDITAPVSLYRPQYGAEYYRNFIFNIASRAEPDYNVIMGSGMVRNYFTEQEREILGKLITLKQLPIEQRILEVFMEIDFLGNYTQSTWFSTLSPHECFQFFRHFYEIWNFRANLSPEIKRRICVLYDPFLNIPTTEILRNPTYPLREICVSIIENIVYGSPDPEYRKIGAMHILTALTFVSRDARENMYWLYESII